MQRTWKCLILIALLLPGLALAATADAPPPRHLIYLHGRIVQEEQNARPRHPQHGYYELEKILEAFRHRGYVVSGEIRPRAASVSESADRVVEQVRRLVASGVPADRITVVGASMGAGIALLASTRLQDSDVRFAILGACLSGNVRALLTDEGKGPSGRLLSIREASDGSTERCAPWKNDSESPPGLVAREIVLHTGLGHGFLFRPLPEWVDPVVAWAEDAAEPDASTADFVLEGGHAAQVEGVAFSRDGRWLASADNGGRVVLWDLRTRRPLRSFEGRNFTEVAFTPDAKLLVAAGFDGKVYVWRTETGKAVREIGYPGHVEALALSPDGRLVAAGGGDHTVRIWDLKTGRETLSLRGHGDDIYTVRFSPDGKRLATGGRDRTIRFWDVRSDKELRVLRGLDDSIYAVAFSDDGRRLVSACRDGTIKIWDAATGRERRTLTGHTDSVHGVALSPDGGLVASAGFDSTVRLWDAATGGLLRTLTDHLKKVSDVAFSLDGRCLASASSDLTVRLWRIEGQATMRLGEAGG